MTPAGPASPLSRSGARRRNLAALDSFLLVFSTTGTAGVLDCHPAAGKVSGALQDRPVLLHEMLSIFGCSLGARPKLVLLNVCGDAAERALANARAELLPRRCDASLYQSAVDDKPGMVLIFSLAASKVHHRTDWTRRVLHLVRIGHAVLPAGAVPLISYESDTLCCLLAPSPSSRTNRTRCVACWRRPPAPTLWVLDYLVFFRQLWVKVLRFPGALDAACGVAVAQGARRALARGRRQQERRRPHGVGHA